MTGLDRKRAGLALALIPIVAAAIGLRIWQVDRNALWLDEAYSAYAADKGFAFLWKVVPLYETHPPFYYTLLRLWTLAFGDGLIGLRSLGLLAGVLTIPVVAAGGWLIGSCLGMTDRDRALLALAGALLACVAPPLLEMSREVRPYPIMILVYAGSIAALFALARARSAGADMASKPYATYLALFALMLWLHNLGIFFGAALGLAFLVLTFRLDWSRQDWTAFLIGHCLVALAWLPALLILRDQAPTWVRRTWLTFHATDLQFRLPGLWAVFDPYGKWSAVLLLLVALGRLFRTAQGRRVWIALFLLATVPAGLSILVSMTIAPVFIPRILSPVSVPAILLFSLGLLSAPGIARGLALVPYCMLLSQMAVTDLRILSLGAREPWYSTVRWLAQRYQVGDVIYAYPNEGALPLTYALRDIGRAMTVRAIPTPVPTLDGGPGAWNPTGSRGVFSLPQWHLERIAADSASRAAPTIWLLREGKRTYDPGDLFLKALSRERVVIAHLSNGPTDIYGLRRRDPIPREEPKR